jgi:hypothetical protein
MPVDHQYAPGVGVARPRHVKQTLLLCIITKIPSQFQILPSPAKPAEAPAKPIQGNKLGFPWTGFSEISLFNWLS